MYRSNHRKFAKTYFRQGFVSILLLCLTLFLGYHASLTQALFPEEVKKFSQLESERYVNRHPIIRIRCDKLYYTGYDNHSSNNKVTGHYYYATQNDRCLYVLINSSNAKPADVIEDYSGTVRLLDDQTLFNQLTGQFAESMEWSSNSLREICLPLIASEPDCHFSTVLFFSLAIVACLAVFLCSTTLNFYHYYKCIQHRKRIVSMKES